MKTETKRKAIMKKEVKKDLKKDYEQMYKSQVKLCNTLTAELTEQGLELVHANNDSKYFRDAYYEKCDDLFRAEIERDDKPGWGMFVFALVAGFAVGYLMFGM